MKVRKFIQVSLLIISLLAGYQWLVAAYLTDMPVQVNQPDGTMINCFASGDEYHNWLHDEDGYTIIQSPDTGYYTYAIQTGDTVSASDLIVGLNDPQLAGLNPKINISEGEYQLRRESAFPEQETRSAPTTGTINNIVIFIRFSDQTEFVEDISLYDGWFNSNASSLKNYFLEVSYSQLTVNTTLYPAAVNNLIVSWQDSHPRAYYSPYNAITNPIGYNSESARRSRELTLLQNATNSVSSQIPSDLNIDSDSDGKVDNIVYVVRGGTDSWNSLLWPHKWSFYDRNVYIHGKKVDDFNFQLQNYLNDKNVGVLCHEFFHTLGAPDLYHYDLDYLNPVGIWDLMAVSINPPIHMGAYMKWKYGGWISTIPVISTHQAYTIHPLTSPSNNAYKIISPNSDSEYFIVEYRKKSGTYENRLEGSGLLIYRINTDAGNGNSDGPPDEVYIYRPGGTLNQDGNYFLAHYSSEEGRTEMNAMTDPSPFLSNDDAGGLEISEIGTAGDTIGFRLGPPPAHISGTVFLEDSQEHVCDVVVELIHPNDIYDEDAYAYQTTHPDANGVYQFEVPNGQHRVRYRLFDLESGLSYYPYISPVMTMGPDTPDFHITVPQYTLKNMTISQLMVSSNEDDRVFSSFSEAIKHAKVIIASPFYAQNVVNINISGGDYYWPWTAPSHGDITVSCNNPNVVKSIVIRGNTSDITSISPRYIEELDIQATNIALQFSNIHFNQAAGETNDCTYTIHTADNGSIKFYNCCFGFREYENQTQYRTHRFVNSSNIEFDNCKFIACRANRGDFGILKFDNCNDVRIVHTEFHKCVAQFGGAIHITSCEGVNVSNCTFDSNHSLDNNVGSISDGTEGGAIFVYDSQNLFFNDNRFIHNEACGGGGPLYLRNCSTFSIVGNEFIENYNDHLGLDTEGSYSVGFQTCHFDDTKPFERNIIKSVETISSHFLLIGSACTGNLVIQNCVFDLDNASEEYNCILFSYSPVNALFDNCVFDTGLEVARFITSPNCYIVVINSLFSNVHEGVTSQLNNHCNIDNMGLDEDYRPIWNTVMKSPCIDAGNPDLNNDGNPWYADSSDQDPDGTQMDIGGIPLIDGHIHRVHRLTNDKVRYISIPGVVNYTDSGEQNLLYHVFHEFRDNGLFETGLNAVLQEIKWRYNDDDNYANPYRIPEHYVHSQNGYKVTLTEDAEDMLIQYHGYYPGNTMNQGMFIQDLDRYTTDHYILPPDADSPEDSNTGIPYREIYLGYYLSESLKPFDALNPILDNITAIFAEDWAWVRLPSFGYIPVPGAEPSDAYTDNWLGCRPAGSDEITINPGEMVVIRYIGQDPSEFKLGGDNPDPPFTDPHFREMASHFGYEEQPEYVPIFLSIDLNQFEDGNKPVEVAVFVDEECKGAAVILDEEVQLNAYVTNITDPSEELKNLEFRMFFPGKAANANVLDYSVLNNQSGRFESRKIAVSECKEFLQIRIGKTEETPVPSITQLFNNYPNPFNPETTIRFDLAEPGPVTIDVFNIKGQKMQALVNDSFISGQHSIIWDGTDSKGKPVASGVYFYRMTTPKSTLVHKMLLMK